MPHPASRRAVRVLLGVVLTALSVATAPAQAAPPTVTGLSKTSIPDRSPVTITVSGTGFTGATRVELISRSGSDVATPATSFTVASDRTITATFAPPSGFNWWVRISGPEGDSTVTTATLLDVRSPSQDGWATSQDVRCTLGGTSLTATLSTGFRQSIIGWDPTVSPAGKTEYLGDFHGSLSFDGSVFSRSQPVHPTGPGNATSVAFDVTGAGVSSLELISGPYATSTDTWISRSEDGNLVEAPIAPYVVNQLAVPNLSAAGRVTGTVRVVTVDAQMSDGSTAELRCTPTAVKPVFDYETMPVPTLSPATGPAAGGNLVRISGSGFKPDMTVNVDGNPVPSTFVSNKEVTFVAPPHAPGTARVAVGQLDEVQATYTYEGSTPFASFTREAPATCQVADRIVPVTARLTARTQSSLQPGEDVTIAGGNLSLIFASADAPNIGQNSDVSYAVRSSASFAAQGATATGTYADASRLPDSTAPDRSTRALNYALSFSPRSLGPATAAAGGAVTLAGGSFTVYAIINVDAGSRTLLTCTFDDAAPLVRIPVAEGSAPMPTPIPTATPSPTPVPTTRFSYSLQGSTKLNTLTKGSMPLTGGVDGTLAPTTGDVTADLTLNDTQARLTALGFLPVTATVGFVSSGVTTGKLVGDQLTTSSKVRVRVKSVKAFGIPVVSGNTCQSKSLSTITLKSTDSFDPAGTGGTLSGNYAISDLSGCGLLNGLISPITAGAGNTITVKLTPKR